MNKSGIITFQKKSQFYYFDVICCQKSWCPWFHYIYLYIVNDYINEKNFFDTFSKLFKSILTLFVLTTNIIPDS